MDRVRRQWRIKHRSFRIWTGWATCIGSLIIMGLIYNACVMRAHQHQHGLAASSIQSRTAFLFTSGEDLHVSNAKSLDTDSLDDLPADLQPPPPPLQQQQQQEEKWVSISPPHASQIISLADACKLLQEGMALTRGQYWATAIPLLDQGLTRLLNLTDLRSKCTRTDVDASIYALARSYAETNRFDLARRWTDKLYESRKVTVAEPAYHLCRRLREVGHHVLAFYYYLIAMQFSIIPQAPNNNATTAEPAIYDYLLDYEKSILWSYVGDIHERHSRLHALKFSMKLLENPRLPHYLRESVQSNLQYYSVHVGGPTSILRAEKSVDEEWRYSTPTFLDKDVTLIRVVNYYVDEDGRYHVSPRAGDRVNTKLVIADTEEVFTVQLSPAFQHDAAAHALIHPDAYILGLEDTRVVRDYTRNGILYTLSASQQFSFDGRTMNQVLGVLDLNEKIHTIQNVIKGPYTDRHDKNWVFAGGIDNIVYGWYPSIEIGALDLAAEEAALRIHTTVPSPASFEGMRGSTNGVLYEEEWWFVTHTVIYRPERMRRYLHRLVVLDKDLGKVVRYSLPFTFEESSDVEYCLGLKVDDKGLTFGYSVRDRSSRIMHVKWMGIGVLFEYV